MLEEGIWVRSNHLESAGHWGTAEDPGAWGCLQRALGHWGIRWVTGALGYLQRTLGPQVLTEGPGTLGF